VDSTKGSEINFNTARPNDTVPTIKSGRRQEAMLGNQPRQAWQSAIVTYFIT
jgi:hypothetical protein